MITSQKLLLAFIFALTLSHTAHAEDELGIDIDAIRNEMQAARKTSLKGATTPEGGSLPAGNARLKADEDTLLNEIQNDADTAPAVDDIVPAARFELDLETPPAAVRDTHAAPPVNINTSVKERNDLRGAELELQYIKLKNSFKALTSKIQDVERERDSALDTVKIQKDEIVRVKKENAEVRRRLVLAETEIERLAHEAQTKSEARIKEKMNLDISNRASRGDEDIAAEPTREVIKPAQARKDLSTKNNDVAIATVMVDKIYLRSGPGKDNSPVMTVAKGVRLTVETKKGDWLRVVTPTGSRAWVSAEVVELN